MALAGFSAWVGAGWYPAFLPAALFVASGALALALGARPPIAIYESHLAIGRRIIPWTSIRRLDRALWISPLVVRLTLEDDSRALVVFAGPLDSSTRLLRHMRRYSREALIDGKPYQQFWGEAPAAAEPRQLPSPRYPLLCSEDEAEVERLFQRLKTVGHLDSKSSADE